MNEYPKTDEEIRIWCLEYALQSYSDFSEAVSNAEKLYEFICHHKEVQQESQTKSPEQKSLGFLSKLRCLLKLH